MALTAYADLALLLERLQDFCAEKPRGEFAPGLGADACARLRADIESLILEAESARRENEMLLARLQAREEELARARSGGWRCRF